MMEIQPRRSLLGIPPSVASELHKQCFNPKPYLSVRGQVEYEELIKTDSLKPVGCVDALLSLPGLRRIRKALPPEFKERIKEKVKSAIGDKIEP